MPNDCWNHVTIYGPPETIKRIAEAKMRIVELVTQPPSDTNADAVNHFGSDRFYEWGLDQLGQEAIQFHFVSAWSPPIAFFDRLLREFSLDFMKVTWSVEDGAAGTWVAERSLDGAADGGYLVQSMHWDDGCLEEKAHRWREAS